MASVVKPQQQAAVNYTLPRILCLHGGGTNAQVFQMQCRALIWALESKFRFVFVEGPIFSPPHEAIVGVYDDFGPFRRWLGWLPEHRRVGVDDQAEWEECRYAVKSVMEADDNEAKNALGDMSKVGEWAGLLGFSQGCRVAASLLFEKQLAIDRGELAMGDWEWAVLFAGRGPLLILDALKKDAEQAAAAQGGQVGKLKMPTLHVHGLLDEGLPHHRLFLEEYCEPGSAKLLEWDGDHRLPIKTVDVQRVVDAMLELSKSRMYVSNEEVKQMLQRHV